MSWIKNTLAIIFYGGPVALVLYVTWRYYRAPRFWTTICFPLGMAAVEIMALGYNVQTLDDEDFDSYEFTSLQDPAWTVSLLLAFGGANLLQLVLVVLVKGALGASYEASPHSITISGLVRGGADWILFWLVLACVAYLTTLLVLIRRNGNSNDDDNLETTDKEESPDRFVKPLALCMILSFPIYHISWVAFGGNSRSFSLVWEAYELTMITATLFSSSEERTLSNQAGLLVSVLVELFSLYTDILMPEKLLYVEEFFDTAETDTDSGVVQRFAQGMKVGWEKAAPDIPKCWLVNVGLVPRAELANVLNHVGYHSSRVDQHLDAESQGYRIGYLVGSCVRLLCLGGDPSDNGEIKSVQLKAVCLLIEDAEQVVDQWPAILAYWASALHADSTVQLGSWARAVGMEDCSHQDYTQQLRAKVVLRHSGGKAFDTSVYGMDSSSGIRYVRIGGSDAAIGADCGPSSHRWYRMSDEEGIVRSSPPLNLTVCPENAIVIS